MRDGRRHQRRLIGLGCLGTAYSRAIGFAIKLRVVLCQNAGNYVKTEAVWEIFCGCYFAGRRPIRLPDPSLENE